MSTQFCIVTVRCFTKAGLFYCRLESFLLIFVFSLYLSKISSFLHLPNSLCHISYVCLFQTRDWTPLLCASMSNKQPLFWSLLTSSRAYPQVYAHVLLLSSGKLFWQPV